MTEGVLYIGNQRYSSWSMRGWLAVRLAELDVEVRVIPFERPGPTPAIAALSPNGLVPFLEHNGARVWESLAICDYCAEVRPGLWPEDRVARAHARSIAAEMHAGFRELRSAMWMNLGRDFSGLGRTAGSLKDIARIEALWADTRRRFGGGGGRFCSVRRSARRMRCSRRSWLGFWAGGWRCPPRRRRIARRCGGMGWWRNGMTQRRRSRRDGWWRTMRRRRDYFIVMARLVPVLCVMAGLVPAIHDFGWSGTASRGWPD